MTKNISIQAYVPKAVSDWVREEALAAGQSRSAWLGSLVHDLYKGQEIREEARKNAEETKQQLMFLGVAIDGLLASHEDVELRRRVHDAYQRKRAKQEPEHYQ